jgi:hypothetical protein
MDITGIGGIGVAAFGASALIGAPGSVSGFSAAQTPVDATMLAGVASGRMDQLLQLMNGFSTAEILLALVLSNSNSPIPQLVMRVMRVSIRDLDCCWPANCQIKSQTRYR